MYRFDRVTANFPANKPYSTVGKSLVHQSLDDSVILTQHSSVDDRTRFMFIDFSKLSEVHRQTVHKEVKRAVAKDCFISWTFHPQDKIVSAKLKENPHAGAPLAVLTPQGFGKALDGAATKADRPLNLMSCERDNEFANTSAEMSRVRAIPNAPTLPIGFFHPLQVRWVYTGGQLMRTSNSKKPFIFLFFLVSFDDHVFKMQELTDIPSAADPLIQHMEQGMPSTPFFPLAKEFVTNSRFLKGASSSRGDGELRLFGEATLLNLSANKVEASSTRFNNAEALVNLNAATIIRDVTPVSITYKDVLNTMHFVSPLGVIPPPRLGTKPPVKTTRLFSWNQQKHDFTLEAQHVGRYLCLAGDNCSCSFSTVTVASPSYNQYTDYTKRLTPSQRVDINVTSVDRNNDHLSQSVTSTIYISDVAMHLRRDVSLSAAFQLIAVQFTMSKSSVNSYGTVPVMASLGFNLASGSFELEDIFTFPNFLARHSTIPPMASIGQLDQYLAPKASQVDAPPTPMPAAVPPIDTPVADADPSIESQPKPPQFTMISDSDDDESSDNVTTPTVGNKRKRDENDNGSASDNEDALL